MLSFAICLMIIVTIISSYYYKKKQGKLLGLVVGNNYVFKKENIKCEIYKTGASKSGYRFNRCDLYVLDNAILITGRLNFLGIKMYSSSVIISKNPDKNLQYSGFAEIVKPSKINPDSFGGSVYIEFGEADWTTTNVNIILKGLSDEEKLFFRTL